MYIREKLTMQCRAPIRCTRPKFHRHSGYGALRTGFFPEIVLRQGSMFASDHMDVD